MDKEMSIYEFGEKLILTKDLDPVYVLLYHSIFSKEKMRRWLIAYWCFYHVGTASWISDCLTENVFWDRMRTAAGSKEYPRSSERRHFRGKNATDSVAYLSSQGIAGLWERFDEVGKSGIGIVDVMDHIETWVGFGPWIAFKVADMIERLGLVKVQFDDAAMFLFDSPREGAELLWETENRGEPVPINVGTWAVERILAHLKSRRGNDLPLGRLLAPPRYERPLNAQEAETILCKWKAYRNGRYEIGEDIHACRRSLLRFPRVRTSQRLLESGRVGGLWD